MNEHQKQRFTNRIISCLYNNLCGKKIAVLGFAFKANTSDTRESPAISLVSSFVAETAQVAIYDPRVTELQIWKELQSNGRNLDLLKLHVTICRSVYAACEDADAVVVVTEWDEFSNLNMNWERIAKRMRRPMFVFDGRNMLDSAELEKLGFRVETIGKASTTPRFLQD